MPRVGDIVTDKCHKCQAEFSYEYRGGRGMVTCLSCTVNRSAKQMKQRRYTEAHETKEPTYNVAGWLVSRGVISPNSLDAKALAFLFSGRARYHTKEDQEIGRKFP